MAVSGGIGEFCRMVLVEEGSARRRSRRAVGLPAEPFSTLAASTCGSLFGDLVDGDIPNDKNPGDAGFQKSPLSTTGEDDGGHKGQVELAQQRDLIDPANVLPGPRDSTQMSGLQRVGPGTGAGSARRQVARPQSAPMGRAGVGDGDRKVVEGMDSGTRVGARRRIRPSSGYVGSTRECDWCGRKCKASQSRILPEETDANTQVMRALNTYDFPIAMSLGNVESAGHGSSTREIPGTGQSRAKGKSRSTSYSSLPSVEMGASIGSVLTGAHRSIAHSAEELMEIAERGAPSGVLGKRYNLDAPAVTTKPLCVCCSWQCCRLCNEKYSPVCARSRRDLALDLLERREKT